MLPDPLHPAVVHLPIALAILVPLVAAVRTRWRRGSAIVPVRGWAFVVLLQVLLVGTAWLAIETGEDQEERVEKVVAERHIEDHEERAERLLIGRRRRAARDRRWSRAGPHRRHRASHSASSSRSAWPVRRGRRTQRRCARLPARRGGGLHEGRTARLSRERSEVDRAAFGRERRLEDRLGQRRVRVAGGGDLARRRLERERERQLRDQLGRAVADDVRAHDLPVAGLGEDLREACRSARRRAPCPRRRTGSGRRAARRRSARAPAPR